jgi:ArsR family transcriptional regulator
MELKEIEKISKALGDVNRLKILLGISKRGGSMQCAEIVNVLNLAQPSVSHHIKTLTEAGLIESEKEGRNYNYLLNKRLLNMYINTIAAIAKNKVDTA